MLNDVTVGIKTFLRDNKLVRAIDGIRRHLPEVKTIVADDGEMTSDKDNLYASMTKGGDQIILMEFDSGFGAKSNRIAQACKTPYLLIGSDDFDFDDNQVRGGISKMTQVLDEFPHLSIVSGRVGSRPYEFYLVDMDGVVEEVPCEFDTTTFLLNPYFPCDLTVNYSLIRREVFEKIGWDDDAKIGQGEHGAWFVDALRSGFETAWVPGVNIMTQSSPDSALYREYRNRAQSPERSCFDKRGIRKYILGDGRVDYEKK
jgi:hypothetical protein